MSFPRRRESTCSEPFQRQFRGQRLAVYAKLTPLPFGRGNEGEGLGLKRFKCLHEKVIVNAFLWCKLPILVMLSLFMIAGPTGSAQSQYPKRELRGAWIATVANIDYPSSGFASSETKTTELIALLDRLKTAGINAVFFQVRTECDALYQSHIEPWSYWLTGRQGKAPVPFFDPLQIAITEAHKRGMELHAWLNPYRAVKTFGEYELSPEHVTQRHPEWILSFRDLKMLDPGLPAVRNYILSIVDDLISRYDVDGIHFDDYFYPYGPPITTEDKATFARYDYGFTNIEDWRRDNITKLIHGVSDLIAEKKPRVKFGVSPFGIVENKFAGTNGFESYHVLYSDPITWLKKKYVDYVLPQIYWEINHPKADFAKLAPWWASVNNGRHVYIGHYASNWLSAKYAGSPNEIENQIRLARTIPNVLGSVFFSAKTIGQNWKNFTDSLLYKFYLYPALIPQMSWKDSIPPNAPPSGTVNFKDDQVQLTWDAPLPAVDGDTASAYVIYKFQVAGAIDIDDPRAIRAIVPAGQRVYSEYAGYSDYIFMITALDRMHNESPASLQLKAVR